MDYDVIGTDARPPWWHTLVALVVTALLSLSTLVFSPLGARFGGTNSETTGLDTLVMLVGMIACLALPATLLWRHRRPFTVVAAAALTPLVLPLGPSVAWVALASLLGRRRGPATQLAIVGVGISTSWITIADWLQQPRAASFLKSVLGPTNGDPQANLTLGLEVPVLAIVLGVGATVLVGLFVRASREKTAAVAEASETKRTSEALGDEVARRAERERIAREVHDALGHRLSIVNLQAGALEANAGDDPKLAESARQVRLAAAAALDDLRSLLAVLRDPLDEQQIYPLTKLAEVVQDAYGTGAPLSSSIFIADADAADPSLSRAVYRIVQELLTNARKHAPGEHVFLQVNGGPQQGITIDCRNAFKGRPTDTPAGSSRGLAGIAERTELLGGTLAYGLDEGGSTFRVTVQLPWRTAQHR